MNGTAMVKEYFIPLAIEYNFIGVAFTATSIFTNEQITNFTNQPYINFKSI